MLKLTEENKPGANKLLTFGKLFGETRMDII
jgi:hypothetical protein